MSRVRVPSATAPFTDDGAMRDESHFGIPMVAQPDPDPRLARGSHPEGPLMHARAHSAPEAMASDAIAPLAPDTAALPEDIVSFDVSTSPEKADSKRARRITPIRHRLPTGRRAVSQPGHSRTGRSPAPRSVWPDVTAAQHRRVAYDPSSSQESNLNKLADQVMFDGEHMAVLKAGIERLHETVEAQAAIIATHEERHNNQAAVNLRGFQEHAELRTQTTARSLRLETEVQAKMAELRGSAETP